jgi:hypothetical protein
MEPMRSFVTKVVLPAFCALVLAGVARAAEPAADTEKLAKETQNPVANLVTANFSASDHDQWTAPIGGGIGKLWRIGKVGLPLNTQIVPFYNVVTPDFGPDWQLRFQFQFLFPR